MDPDADLSNNGKGSGSATIELHPLVTTGRRDAPKEQHPNRHENHLSSNPSRNTRPGVLFLLVILFALKSVYHLIIIAEDLFLGDESSARLNKIDINKCGQHPWSIECYHHYNAGNWTTLDHPRNWSQIYGYHKWSAGPANCERLGKTLEWKSLHKKPSVFDGGAFLKSVGSNKVVSFFGDSLSRQSFAVLLEAIQTPPQACNYGLLSNSNISFPTECVLALEGNDTTNITLRMHNDWYGDQTNETCFTEADIIVLNFGVWYFLNQELGQRTNHTPSNYVSHVIQILNNIETLRKPHQLIVFRESAEIRNPTSQSLQIMTQELRPILIEHRIPIIAHQSTNLDDLHRDGIHWCEPALQLAWLTILLHMVIDWNSREESA